jgi:hypothetical protein
MITRCMEKVACTGMSRKRSTTKACGLTTRGQAMANNVGTRVKFKSLLTRTDGKRLRNDSSEPLRTVQILSRNIKQILPGNNSTTIMRTQAIFIVRKITKSWQVTGRTTRLTVVAK